MPRDKTVEEQIAYVVATDVEVQCEICGKKGSDRDIPTIQIDEGVWLTSCADVSSCKRNLTKNGMKKNNV